MKQSTSKRHPEANKVQTKDSRHTNFVCLKVEWINRNPLNRFRRWNLLPRPPLRVYRFFRPIKEWRCPHLGIFSCTMFNQEKLPKTKRDGGYGIWNNVKIKTEMPRHRKTFFRTVSIRTTTREPYSILYLFWKSWQNLVFYRTWTPFFKIQENILIIRTNRSDLSPQKNFTCMVLFLVCRETCK